MRANARALKGGRAPGRAPVDRTPAGLKHHLITDGGGIPSAVILTGCNTADVTRLLSLVHAIPPIRDKRGRPRQRPETVFGDLAHDSRATAQRCGDSGSS
ncbi:transposase [Umezawaea sp. NPDC059074]|uniref:transposase n=1 Tax=Umezawaea sp. NPDC059074 TaxID=3346716 RepID=UPI0036A29A9C